jgi:isoleucyl-tRNA synthetase
VTVTDTRSARYRTLSPERPAGELEEEMLARGRDEDLFARTLAAREGGEPFVFFEGPPTANGRPGIHHVFSRTVKDLFCRHRAMRGHWVLRKAGWDTHGLPVEIEVEKGLARRLHEERGLSEEEAAKISGKQLIEAFGVEEFNRLCRESLVGAGDAARARTALPGLQDPPLLLALRHGAVEPRGCTGLRGRARSERVRGARSGEGRG